MDPMRLTDQEIQDAVEELERRRLEREAPLLAYITQADKAAAEKETDPCS